MSKKIFSTYFEVAEFVHIDLVEAGFQDILHSFCEYHQTYSSIFVKSLFISFYLFVSISFTLISMFLKTSKDKRNILKTDKNDQIKSLWNHTYFNFSEDMN